MVAMKITFDSNTYRRAVDPARFPNDASLAALQAIHAAIQDGRITPFLSETVASLEGVTKAQRGAYFAAAKPDLNVTTIQLPDGSIKFGITMEPNNALHPGVPPAAERWLKDAVTLGFRFMRAPRISMPTPAFLTAADAYATDDDLEGRQELFHQAGRDLEARGAGMAVAKGIGETIAARMKVTKPWFEVLDKPIDVHEERAIERAIGEWADGDTVAAHIGYGHDAICTEDKGRSAGAPSIFNATNRTWLASSYGVIILNPSELAARL